MMIRMIALLWRVALIWKLWKAFRGYTRGRRAANYTSGRGSAY